jgi:hypothetical protein
MIRGLQKFESHFREYKDQYILIGGSACDLLMYDAGIPFRATKDLDIVLCAEALNEEFVKHFWNFVHDGGYEIKQRSNGDKCFYRFTKPTNIEYPYMLEILSRNSDILGDRPAGAIAPMTIDEEIVSLSAILLDEHYYNFILTQKSNLFNIIIANVLCLIPLKVRAWLDLSKRKENNEQIDINDIKKHKNDIFRLSQLLTSTPLSNVPLSIAEDIKSFVDCMRKEDINLKQLGIIGTTVTEILDQLIIVFKDTPIVNNIA